MQEQRSSDNHPLFPKANNNAAIPMPGTPPPAPYPYLPPSIPNGSVPMQYAPPSVPNGPVQYPSASPYQQQYPAYATSSANTGIGQISLIGGAIACGIDTLLTLLITFVPAIENMLTPLYQFVPLLPGNMVSVGGLIVSLIIALFCSAGFFVIGLQGIRKTGQMHTVMLSCTLALAGFAVIDLLLVLASAAYILLTSPSAPMSISFAFRFWGGIMLGWFIDLIMMSPIAYAAAAAGATIGKQARY